MDTPYNQVLLSRHEECVLWENARTSTRALFTLLERVSLHDIDFHPSSYTKENAETVLKEFDAFEREFDRLLPRTLLSRCRAKMSSVRYFLRTCIEKSPDELRPDFHGRVCFIRDEFRGIETDLKRFMEYCSEEQHRISNFVRDKQIVRHETILPVTVPPALRLPSYVRESRDERGRPISPMAQ